MRKKPLEVLQVIYDYITEHGKIPTADNLVPILKMKKNTILTQLRRLDEMGKLVYEYGVIVSCTVVKAVKTQASGINWYSIPLVKNNTFSCGGY